MRKAIQALGPIVGAILIAFFAFVAFAGALAHPLGALVVFAALLFGLGVLLRR